MNTGKIIKKENGSFSVYCSKIEEFRNVSSCKKCTRFKKIDPVKAVVICKEHK